MKKEYKNEHDLPVPRLQLKNTVQKNGNLKVEYSLIRKQVYGLEKNVLSKSVLVSDSIVDGKVHRPWKSTAHMLQDIWDLKLPAFIIQNDQVEEIFIHKEVSHLVNGSYLHMKDSLKNDPSRQREFDLIEAELVKIRTK